MTTEPRSNEPAEAQNTAAGQILRPMMNRPATSTRMPPDYEAPARTTSTGFAKWTGVGRWAVTDSTPLLVIAHAAQAATAIEAALTESVTAARTAGFSWGDIGTSLGTTAEVARDRYGSAD